MVQDKIRGRLALPAVAVGVLAWLAPSERPGIATSLGGAFVLLGLFLLLRGRRLPAEPIA